MAVQRLTPSDYGARALEIINAAFGAIDDLQRDLAGEVNERKEADRNALLAVEREGGYREANIRDVSDALKFVDRGVSGSIEAEAANRDAAVAGVVRLVEVEAGDRAAGDAAESGARARAIAAVSLLVSGLRIDLDAARAAPASLAGRPGDALTRFTFVRGIADLAGAASALAPLPAALVAFGDRGNVARVRGAGIIATREAYPVEPGRAYASRYAYQRRVNPTDTANDAVRSLLVWLDQAGAILSTTVVEDNRSLLTTSGRQEVGVSFSLTPGAAVAGAPPGACYVRLALQFFGVDALTDAEIIARIDATEATLLDPVSADVATRLGRVESHNAGPRLDVVERQLSAPNGITFATRSDAAAGTIPATVTTVATRGRDAPGDGREGLYSRVASLPAGADGFSSRDGGVWLRVPTAQDLFDSTFVPLFMNWLQRLPQETPSEQGKPWLNGLQLAVS